MSLNETILTNLQTELNMARAKRYINIKANLPTNVIESRIEALNAAIDRVKREMIEQALREAHKENIKDGEK